MTAATRCSTRPPSTSPPRWWSGHRHVPTRADRARSGATGPLDRFGARAAVGRHHPQAVTSLGGRGLFVTPSFFAPEPAVFVPAGARDPALLIITVRPPGLALPPTAGRTARHGADCSGQPARRSWWPSAAGLGPPQTERRPRHRSQRSQPARRSPATGRADQHNPRRRAGAARRHRARDRAARAGFGVTRPARGVRCSQGLRSRSRRRGGARRRLLPGGGESVGRGTTRAISTTTLASTAWRHRAPSVRHSTPEDPS